jgi:hypothetical protein
VARTPVLGQRQWAIDLPAVGGTYLVAIRTEDKVFVERVVSLSR